MRNALLVARRELGAYVRSPLGYIVAAVLLALDGLLFNAFALGWGQRLSAEVLMQFFYFTFGITVAAAVMLSMRLLAEERQAGTLVLLRTSPLAEWEFILGKYLSAMIFLGLMTLATIYMPLLILVNGKISVGHLVVGYLGLLLAGSAALAIGILGSSLAGNQVVAVVVGGALAVGLVTCFWLGKITDPPLTEILASLALYNKHFVSFRSGVLHLRDVVYYLSVTWFCLLLAVRVEAARRWA